jgi:hypothetical protein
MYTKINIDPVPTLEKDIRAGAVVNGKYMIGQSSLVESLNQGILTLHMQFIEAIEYIKAYSNIVATLSSSYLEKDNKKLVDSINSSKYAKPIVEVYCRNAKVTYLHTILNKIEIDLDKMDKILEQYNTFGNKCPLNEFNVYVYIEIALGEPSIVSYREGNEESTILVETTFDECCGIPYNPEYKFKYIRD